MIPYMVGKLAPNSSHLIRGLVKYVPGRSSFRAVSFQNGNKFVTSPPPPQSLNGSKSEDTQIADARNHRQSSLDAFRFSLYTTAVRGSSIYYCKYTIGPDLRNSDGS